MHLPGNLLLIDKPSGITSFDVIRRLRKKLNVRKMGHAGTLDPLASGLLLIGVGDGTKLLKDYIKLPKEYVAEVLIGEKRSTGDIDGVVTETCSVPEISENVLRTTLQSMIGVVRLPVSAYSAIKKDGIPMYKRAFQAEKEGVVITDVPIRDMEVINVLFIESKHTENNEGDRVVVTARFSVGSGTYIRSLAEEFGKRLGYPATLQALRRTKIGEFSVDDAQQLE